MLTLKTNKLLQYQRTKEIPLSSGCRRRCRYHPEKSQIIMQISPFYYESHKTNFRQKVKILNKMVRVNGKRNA